MSCRQAPLPNSVILRMESARIAAMALAKAGDGGDLLATTRAIHDFIRGDRSDDDLDARDNDDQAAGRDAARRNGILSLDIKQPGVAEEIPASVRDMLEQAGYRKVGQLAQMQSMDPNVAGYVRAALAQYGLTTGMSADQLRDWIMGKWRLATDGEAAEVPAI
jgi:hypothetical protein